MLRIFLLQSCTTVDAACQGPNGCNNMNDVEYPEVGIFDDTILQHVDFLMRECYKRNIKLYSIFFAL